MCLCVYDGGGGGDGILRNCGWSPPRRVSHSACYFQFTVSMLKLCRVKFHKVLYLLYRFCAPTIVNNGHACTHCKGDNVMAPNNYDPKGFASHKCVMYRWLLVGRQILRCSVYSKWNWLPFDIRPFGRQAHGRRVNVNWPSSGLVWVGEMATVYCGNLLHFLLVLLWLFELCFGQVRDYLIVEQQMHDNGSGHVSYSTTTKCHDN